MYCQCFDQFEFMIEIFFEFVFILFYVYSVWFVYGGRDERFYLCCELLVKLS